MSDGLRRRVRQHLSGWWRRPEDEGVSPVVGMILVLAISVVGISAILYWGLPAIDEMKANVEFRSVQSQFEELDATIKELVAGTTEKTAKRWQPSLNRGMVNVYNNTEQWLFGIETYAATSNEEFMYGRLTDGNDSFAIYSNNSTNAIHVKAYIVTGTSTSTTLNVTAWGVAGTAQMADASQTFVAGNWYNFKVTQSNVAARIENATFKFEIYKSNVLVAQAWYAATGRIDFQLDAGVGSKTVVANNGAVFTGTNYQFAMVNTPPIPPPSNTSGVPRTFARMISIGGNASFAGTDTYDLLISLYATATLASYDCAETDRDDCVKNVKYVNFGVYRDPWYNSLQNTARGYDYVLDGVTLDGAAIPYLKDNAPYQGFTLLQSSLKVVGG